MKPSIRTAQVLALALTALLGGATLPQAKASDHHECSNASLQGAYGFRQNGTIFAEGLVGGVGIFVFDGNGNLSLSGTFVNQTLGVHHVDATGTYTVNSDCTGSAEAGGTVDFVIVAGGNEVFVIATRPDRVVTWVIKKQFPRAGGGQEN